MKKVVFIDVGTHFGQEYNALMCGSRYMLYRIVRHLCAFILGRAKEHVKIRDLIKLIKVSRDLRNCRYKFFSILVEPNPRLFSRFCYRDCDLHLPIAMSSSEGINFGKLFYTGGNKTGQGSSLFLEKEGTLKTDFAPVVVANSSETFSYIFEQVMKENPYISNADIMLRLNCEGVEDEVIYAAYKVFGRRLVKIFGSLKDVEEIKGVVAYKQLSQFMESNLIVFEKFSPNLDTWLPALTSIQDFISKRD